MYSFLYCALFVNIVTRYMHDAVRRDFALSASFVLLECFDGSEVTTRKGNESIVQKENCFMQERKEVELRSSRGKFIYNRTSIGLNQVSHFCQRSHAPSRLPMNKLKSLLLKTRKVTLFVWKSIRKNTPLSSEIHCYVKNRKGLHLNRYRSNCNSVRFLLKGQLQN